VGVGSPWVADIPTAHYVLFYFVVPSFGFQSA